VPSDEGEFPLVRLVVDTNVVVSGFLSAKGMPAAILDQLRDDQSLVVLWDPRVLAEYAEVLARPKFGLNPAHIEAFLDFIRIAGESATPAPYWGPMPDPDDRVFLEVALGGNADVLVTGNRRHFPNGPFATGLRILSPAQLFAVLTVRSIARAVYPFSWS
jgi:putative PIN family toxin of toxin-antitoxin system